MWRFNRKNFGAHASAFLEDDDNRQWLMDAGAAVGCVAVLGTIFWRETFGALRVWLDSPTFNHCFLILPLSLFMMWMRRKGLAAVPHAPRPGAALLLLPLSFAWLVAFFASILEAQQVVVITMLQVMLFSVLGWPAYRRLIAPFLYLYFLVPSGAELVPALQQFTAHFAVLGLRLIGIPVFSDGAVIDIPSGSFAVAEACAGLRFLVATVAFGVFYATQVYRSVFRRLAFIGLSIIVPIIANGLRVFGLIAAAQWMGNPAAALADHLIYGWGFFSLVLILLVFVGRAFSDRDDGDDLASTPVGGKLDRNMWRNIFAGLLSTICAASFPIVVLFLPASNDNQLPGLAPAVSKPWSEVSDDSNWKPIVTDPSRSFEDAFSNGQEVIYRFVALYREGAASNLIRSENRIADERVWKFDSSKPVILHVSGRDIPAVATTIANGAERLTVWSFYVVDGQILTSTLTIKLLELRGRFLGSRCSSAFVAIAAQDLGQSNAANDRTARYLSAVQPFSAYLCDGSKHTAAKS
jgi:exosortase A